MNECKILQTLWEHEDIIKLALSTARERVMIISPYISIGPINAENIPMLVRQSVDRGVRVQVFVDAHVNCYRNGEMKSRALDGIAALVEAGAQVAVCNGIQRKTLSRDYDLFAEGAFNWFSAVLFRSGERQLKEGTRVYSGETAASMISRELANIEEVGYEFAVVKENGGTEITRAGIVFCQCFALFILYLILSAVTDKIGAFIFLTVIIGAVIGLYKMWGRGADCKKTVPQMH